MEKVTTSDKSDAESLYRDLTNDLPGALFRYVLLADGTDKIDYMSAGSLGIWELAPEVAIADPQKLWAMIHPEDVTKLQESIFKSAESLAPWSHEWHITTPTGKIKRLNGTGSPKKTDNGSVQWNSIVIDVTAEHHIKKAFESFFGQQFSLNAIFSFDGDFLKVNEHWEHVLGYSRNEIEGLNLLDFLHPDDQEATLSEKDLIVEESVYSERFINRYRHKDGSYRWFSWSSNISHDENLIYASALDITESRKAEDKLRQAAAVFESTAEGVMITDLNSNIIEVNKAFCEITGFSESESIGQKPSFLQSGIHDESFYNDMWRAIKNKGHWKGEIWNRRKDGSIFPELLTINTIVENDEKYAYVGVFSDISTLKEHQQKLVHLAHHDPLTDLPNRLLFNEKLKQSIVTAERRMSSLAVIFIDLDRFKHINDSMGHPVGDALLLKVAQRLSSSTRQTDMVARISGDEFVVLVEDVAGIEDVSQVTQNLLETFRKPIVVNGIEISLTASMGISLYPQDAKDISTIMANADAAMYQAKDSGKNTYKFYSAEFTSQAAEFVYMENALRRALSEEQFFLVFQPQITANHQSLAGMEALIRWQHPKDGLIPPGRFIPIAEQNGTIREIGKWVLDKACEQAAIWHHQGFKIGKMAINISPRQFYNENFVEDVVSVLDKHKLPASLLEMEITEGLVISNAAEAIEKLEQIRNLGISVSLDDFGTGYSSLSYLKKLPVDRLKIDSSFIMDIPDDEDDEAITDAIIGLAKTLNLAVIAEGVETLQQLEFLSGKNCDYQGYYFSKPLVSEDIPAFILSLIGNKK